MVLVMWPVMFRYEPFDFHKECKAMKWYRLSLLMDRIASDQQQFGSELWLIFQLCFVLIIVCAS